MPVISEISTEYTAGRITYRNSLQDTPWCGRHCNILPKHSLKNPQFTPQMMGVCLVGSFNSIPIHTVSAEESDLSQVYTSFKGTPYQLTD